MKQRGAHIIWSCLVEQGVDTVFGYPGGAILPAYDALLDHPIRHVLVRHEQGATHMADGYARASGRVGVAIATSGPGATNLVTGIATAMMDSIPVVCITGQVAESMLGSDAFQETDITGITLPITKHNYLVTRAADIAPTLRDAFRIATSGRPGPVLVDITKNAQQEEAEWEPSAVRSDGSEGEGFSRRHESAEAKASALRTSLEQATELLAAAKRPVILAGHGILKSGAMAEVLTLAERAHIPIAMTLLGIGSVPARHPLNLGMMGMHGEAWVNDAIQEADLLLALGMRFDDRVTGKLASYAQHAKKIHIDIDPSELHKNVRADVAVQGDLRTVLLEWLPQVEAKRHDAWIARISDLACGPTVRGIEELPDDGKLCAAHVIHDIWKATEGKAIIVTDVGQHQMWTAQYYKVQEPGTFITSGGLGTMGFGLPAAIGAKIARPDKEVWAIVGDGGFQMTQAELQTMVQENVKVNVAIINNGYLGMVRQWQQFFHDRRYSSTPLSSPDYVKLADAHGLPGVRVTKRADVHDALRHARASAGAVVMDFRVVQEDTVYPMVSPGAALNDMIRRPGSPSLAETGADA
ncbi:MAG: biosynthetic-type acetolactate synthase large subunit [Acidobacteria bacterium]|nr:biosynthetic-type acetolactate synthase large subunit [Acidobacteriota bacterium]MSO62795.1 biosynthetic-type acetolactate synthase large subunit [Acidobacteriota bacterium]